MNFKRGANDIYKNDEKLELAKTVEKYKRLYYKRKRHVAITPKWGFYSNAVREFYADMEDVSNDNPDF